MAAGLPDDDSDLKGGVFAASYGYGLDGLTLRTGGVFNQDWQGVSAEAVLGLSYLGRCLLTALMPRQNTVTAAAAGIRCSYPGVNNWR